MDWWFYGWISLAVFSALAGAGCISTAIQRGMAFQYESGLAYWITGFSLFMASGMLFLPIAFDGF